jgi:tetratricopeptide (TPR) repeat protein
MSAPAQLPAKEQDGKHSFFGTWASPRIIPGGRLFRAGEMDLRQVRRVRQCFFFVFFWAAIYFYTPPANAWIFSDPLAAEKLEAELNPDFGYAWEKLGNKARSIGKHDVAISAYKKAIEVKPSSRSRVLLKLGGVYFEKKEYALALVCWRTFQNNEDLWGQIAVAYRKTGNISLAEKYEAKLRAKKLKQELPKIPDFEKARSLFKPPQVIPLIEPLEVKFERIEIPEIKILPEQNQGLEK